MKEVIKNFTIGKTYIDSNNIATPDGSLFIHGKLSGVTVGDKKYIRIEFTKGLDVIPYNAEWVEITRQKITSKDTSINSLAGFYKKAVKNGILGNGETILDYGCGKYFSKIDNFANENNFAVTGYDPYHLLKKTNVAAISKLNLKNLDFIVCNNVLNVLTDKALCDTANALKDLNSCYGTPILITVYEGDKTGQGRPTKKGYQRNDKTARYAEYLKDFFDTVTVKYGIITCK